ncbi:hypothetical protein BC832DRAFT_543025 [Gaertneriomyces semiglobifer]|nr:hypothetical protein BC832DRAFT_543025 [Gaertneriomyces semiglobifer]
MPDSSKKSSPIEYITSVLRSNRRFRAVNFFKHFQFEERQHAEQALRHSLENIDAAARSPPRVKTAAKRILSDWDVHVIRDEQARRYWVCRDQQIAKEIKSRHKTTIFQQVSDQQLAVGGALVREIAQEQNGISAELTSSRESPQVSTPNVVNRSNDMGEKVAEIPEEHLDVFHEKTNSTFTFAIPGTTMETPNKPKFLDSDLQRLRRKVQPALSSTIHRSTNQLPPAVLAAYHQYRMEANSFASLKQFPASYQSIHDLLIEDNEWEEWDDRLCVLTLPFDCSRPDRLFWKIARLGMPNCWEKLVPTSHTTVHERTALIGHVIPWLSLPVNQAVGMEVVRIQILG